MTQAASRSPLAAAPPKLRLAGAAVPADERFAALRRFRGTPEAFLAELLALQAQLAGAEAGWAFPPGGGDAVASVGGGRSEPAAALAQGPADEAPHPLESGASGVLTRYRLGDASAPTVVLLAAPAAGSLASLTRERVTLTGTLWDAFSRGVAAERLADEARLAGVASAAAAEDSLEAAALALAAALVDRLGPGRWRRRWAGRRRGACGSRASPRSPTPTRGRGRAGRCGPRSRRRGSAPLPPDDPAATLAAEALGTPAALAVVRLRRKAGRYCCSASTPPASTRPGPRRRSRRWPPRPRPPSATSPAPNARSRAAGPRRSPPPPGPASGPGPAVAARRLATAAALAGVVFVAAVPVAAPVRAGFTAEAAGAREVAAPYEGELASVLAHPGDAVVGGETVLGTLATDELRLELAGLRAERTTFLREADDTRGADPTAARLAELEVLRLDGGIALAEHRLNAATLLAPISGVVVSTDLDRRVGTPVTRGQTLFEVADPAALSASVAVPEGEAQRVRVGARGWLRPASHPGLSLPGTVDGVRPIAEPGPAGTTVRVDVRFDRPPAWLKPGSRGSASLEAGRAPLLWQWIRPTVRALRLHL